MAIPKLTSSDAGERARAKINAAFGETDKVASRLDATQAAAQSAVLTAADAKSLAPPSTHRPGDGIRAFTFVPSLNALGGEADALAPLDGSKIAFAAAGGVVRLVGQGVLAAREAEAIEPGRILEVRAAFRRRANASDPSNDTVRTGLLWLDQAKNPMPGPAFAVIADLNTLLTSSGRQEVRAYVAASAGDGITIVAPAGAAYFRRFVHNFGFDGVTDVETLASSDVTGLAIPPTVTTDVLNRLAAQESVNAGARLQAVEQAVQNPNSLTFPTQSDAAAAQIPTTVSTVRLNGLNSPGDGQGGIYLRVASLAPLTPGFTSADGGVWQRSEEAYLQITGQTASDVQARLNANFQAGGYRSTLSTGDRRINTPLIMRRGTTLKGQGDVPARDTPASGSPFLRSTILRASADLDFLIGQNPYGTGQTSNRIEDITIDGGGQDTTLHPDGYKIGAVLRFSTIGARFDAITVSNGTGIGFEGLSNGDPTQPGFQPAWVNILTRSNVNNFVIGVLWEYSDSLAAFNNFGGSSINFYHRSSGGLKLIGNQLEVASQYGAVIESDKTGVVGSASLFGLNFFHLNAQADINVRRTPNNPNLGEDARHNFVGNSSVAYARAFLIESYVAGGQIVGHVAVGPSTQDFDIEFGGVGNNRWAIWGLSSDRLPNKRVKNLPPDCPILSTGLGGPYNRLNALILSSTDNPVEKNHLCTAEVYGHSSVNGQSGVAMRVGWARENSGTDAALYLGSVTGNTPFIGFGDGETTQPAIMGFVAPDHQIKIAFDRSGDLSSYVDGQRSLGTGSSSWNNVYYRQLVQRSDARDKVVLSPEGGRFDALLDALHPLRFSLFRYIAAVQEKGEAAARIHFGFIAQEVIAALEAGGFEDPFALGLICEDRKFRKEARTVIRSRPKRETVRDLRTLVVKDPDSEGGTKTVTQEVEEERDVLDAAGAPVMEEFEDQEVVEVDTGETRFSVRFEQILAVKVAWLERDATRAVAEVEALKQRVSALEAAR